MSLFGRRKKDSTQVGLDIGSHSLKLVEIREKGDERYLVAMGIKDLRPGIVENGDIKDKESFIEAVRSLVDRCDSNIVDVVISLGGQGILSDKANFKIEPNEDISDTIYMEATGRSPFDANDITLSYKILRRFPEKNEVEVLLVAAKNQIMQNYIDALYEAGLRPIVVDVDTYAFNNCYAMESYAEAALPTLVLIDIGHVSCRVIFVKDGLYHSSRDITTAGEYFVKTLKKMLKIPEKDAEDLLHGKNLTNVSDEEFHNALSYALEEFAGSFDMAFSYFKKTENVDIIDKVVICGGGAYIPNIVGYLKERLETDVVRSDPFKFLRYDPVLFGGADLKNIPAARLSVAVGLALRKVD